MTLAAPRSRQGKLMLVLAFLVAATTVAGVFLWVTSAQAVFPSSTATIQAQPAPGTVNPGDLLTYTFRLTINSGTTSGTDVDFRVTLPAGVTNPTVTAVGAGWVLGTCSTAISDGDLVLDECQSAGPVTTGTFDFTVTFKAGTSGVTAFTASFVDSDATTLTTPSTTAHTVNGVTNTGNQTAFPGVPTVITFTVPIGMTYCSDIVPDTARTFNNNASTGDLVVNPASAVVTGPSATLLVTTSPDTATVTVNSATPGSVTATLSTHLATSTVTTDCTPSLVTVTVAAPTGSLCHFDFADPATENVAGNIKGILYAGNTLANGCQQTDVDDATGSLHAACIEGSTLTFAANGAQISWTITAVNGGPAAGPLTPFAGPVGPGEPCVRWSAGGTGTQHIAAVWTSGTTTVTFFWNGSCTAGTCTLKPGTGAEQPLIKEWNTIDSTKIISATGNVGDTLSANTLQLKDWVSRDCSFTPAIDPGGFCKSANLNGTTKDISGVLMPNGVNISAAGASFIDYTMGSHKDAGGVYSGPVDGAQQIYCNGTLTITETSPGSGIIATSVCSASGSDCGSVRVEDPATGNVNKLKPGDKITVNSSDKGVGFQVVPNNAGVVLTTTTNGNCQPDSCATVTIDTREAGLFHSPPLMSATQETISVCFHVGPPTNKQPILAWAGQRIVLEHDWGFTDANGARTCPFQGQFGSFFVRYVKESGNGALISDLGHGAATGPDFMVVKVSGSGSSNTDADSNCVSRVIYESQDQGEQDVVAHVVVCAPAVAGPTPSPTAGPTEIPPSPTASPTPSPSPTPPTPTPSPTASPTPSPTPVPSTPPPSPSVDPDTCTVVSEQVAFLAFYMKFEDVTLKLLPDATTHGSLPQVSSTAVTPPAGVDTTTANVSANVLARATVRGWVLADNCPAANVAKTGSNGEALPANRCIFPDDWAFKAGGNASDARKNYDNYGGSTSGCSNVAGPYSLLDPVVFDSKGNRLIVCGDSLAPHAPFNDGQRETNFPDGVINANDAPMPSALMRFLLTGSGFLIGADKHNANSQFDVTHIPAEPWISRVNADLSGYQWNSWGTGPKSGVYNYWTDFADHGPDVLSCGGAAPCTNGKATGGFLQTRVYTDEHGNAMTWVNGDANLDFTKCAHSAATAGHKVVLLNGFFCQPNDVVGTSTINALADYPDKRKHFAIVSSNVTISWTWGGIKNITVEPDPADATGQFHYVVLHVTDRDGFCGSGNSLHPVLGETVIFTIDSPTGVIFHDQNGRGSADGNTPDGSKSATVTTFSTAANTSVTTGGIDVTAAPPAPDECQAWIHISESQLANVNVTVEAFDPEGTVTFDTRDINPTPTPSPVPPTATPRVLHLKWGDTDCDGTVAPRDEQAILKRILEQPELSVNQPCPGLGQQIIVAGNTQHWADWDCSGSITPRDGQAVLKNVLMQTALSQTAPCPVVGSAVDVQVITLP